MSKEIQKAILEEFLKNPEQKRSVLIEVLNCYSGKQIDGSIDELIDRGRLERTGRGSYRFISEEEATVAPVKKKLQDLAEYLNAFVDGLNIRDLVPRDLDKVKKVDKVINELNELNSML